MMSECLGSTQAKVDGGAKGGRLGAVAGPRVMAQAPLHPTTILRVLLGLKFFPSSCFCVDKDSKISRGTPHSTL